MRNMSFMLTKEQMYNKTKSVTRRNGWKFLKAGDIVQAVEKCQGLKKGESIKPICLIEIIDVREESLEDLVDVFAGTSYPIMEMVREGFPEMHPFQFADMFINSHKGVTNKTKLTRVEFKFI